MQKLNGRAIHSKLKVRKTERGAEQMDRAKTLQGMAMTRRSSYVLCWSVPTVLGVYAGGGTP